jgi:hypothetical protein
MFNSAAGLLALHVCMLISAAGSNVTAGQLIGAGGGEGRTFGSPNPLVALLLELLVDIAVYPQLDNPPSTATRLRRQRSGRQQQQCQCRFACVHVHVSRRQQLYSWADD